MIITKEKMAEFKNYLLRQEKEKATAEKYVRDVRDFSDYLKGKKADKKRIVEYKIRLMEKRAPSGVNAALAGLNSFFAFAGQDELKLKCIKISKNSFADKEREMTADEYRRLLSAAKKKSERLCLLMQTVCSCGLRVSELRFVTVDAALSKRALIALKGKIREVLLPGKLCRMLLKYAKKSNIKSGAVFITRTGRPLDVLYLARDEGALQGGRSVGKEGFSAQSQAFVREDVLQNS